MTTKNLTTDQKVDLILEKVTELDGKVEVLSTKVDALDGKVDVLDNKVASLQKNQNDLINTVSEMAIVIGKSADRLEAHIRQTSHEDKSGSFTHFTSGAFIA